MGESSESYFFKIVLLGDSIVEKCKLFNRLAGQQLKFLAPSVGVRLCPCKFHHGGKLITVHIWDTGCQESSAARVHFHRADGAFLIFDITNRSSFSRLKDWLTDLRVYGKEDIVVSLVGTKGDFRFFRAVEHEEATEFSERERLFSYMEASANDNRNVDYALMGMIKRLLKNARRRRGEAMPSSSTTITSGENVSVSNNSLKPASGNIVSSGDDESVSSNSP